MIKELIYRLAIITIFLTPVNLFADYAESFALRLQRGLAPRSEVKIYLESGAIRKGLFVEVDLERSELLIWDFKFSFIDMVRIPISTISTVRSGSDDIRRIAPFWASSNSDEEKCRRKILNQIKDGGLVSIFDHKLGECEGKVTHIDSINSNGTVQFYRWTHKDTLQFNFNEIAKIKYPQVKIRPLFMVLGLIGGPLLGFGAKGIMSPTSNQDYEALAWGAGGAGAGLLIGTFFPLLIPKHLTFECGNCR